MVPHNHLSPSDHVRITVQGPNGGSHPSIESDGFNNVMQAIVTVCDTFGLTPADFADDTFLVENLTRNTSGRYRINAHGNLKLVV